jgi:vancomycin resistance protein YoaR
LSLFISLPLLASGLDKLDRYLYGVKPGVTVNGEEVGGLLLEEVIRLVEHLAIRHQKVPSEPALDRNSGEIIPEVEGYIIDVEYNVQQILAAEAGERLKLKVIPVYPKHRGAEIEEIKDIIASYSTWISGSAQRQSNIQLAVKAINNTLLWPGELFSFNEVVGPRTMLRGYQPAPIIMMGHMEMDFGGGVCQVASTLYNAAAAADLTIIERHQHSRPVHYVPKGKDATVNYGYLDLKFKNNLNTPLIVKAWVGGNQVWVNILGREK